MSQESVEECLRFLSPINSCNKVLVHFWKFYPFEALSIRWRVEFDFELCLLRHSRIDFSNDLFVGNSVGEVMPGRAIGYRLGVFRRVCLVDNEWTEGTAYRENRYGLKLTVNILSIRISSHCKATK